MAAHSPKSMNSPYGNSLTHSYRNAHNMYQEALYNYKIYNNSQITSFMMFGHRLKKEIQPNCL